MANKPITEFIEKYYLHFNAASLVDASKGYVAHLKDGGKMLITASASFQLVLKNITELEALRILGTSYKLAPAGEI